jgi:hypothetical protein
MHRLIERGLMFGNLIEVSSPVLVARYNRALEKLTGQRTELPDFHIDISGFSPEIGHELDDELYLNPNGCNRQFILLTTEQKTAPLLNAQFSMSRGILRDFIEANEAQLFALTARDAVLGELENSVFDVSVPARLFDILRITVQADTTDAHVANAEELQNRIVQFRTEPDAWWDDVLIAEMIGLAKKTGDVTRNPLVLAMPAFTKPSFWTAFFGGLYIFRDVEFPAVITPGKSDDVGDVPVENVYSFSYRNGVAQFLDKNGLAEPIVQARGADAVAILRQKMDFILVDIAASLGRDVPGQTRADLRKLARQLGSALPEEFHALASLVRWAEQAGPWPHITSDQPAYFYTLRATPGPNRDLVNRLLAELSPLDIRQLFICHKEAFYRAYAGWPDAKKDYVATFLEREYAVDKAGARVALFGSDDPVMADPPSAPKPTPERDDLIARVGPWGAVRRR